MKVTREVIYDLLPGYFSGDISPDTRALVDEFLREDPEFARMMERFRQVFRDPAAGDRVARPRDTQAFEQARALVQKRSELRGYIIAFSLATVFGLLVLVAAERAGVIRLLAIPGAFALTAGIAAFQLYVLKKQESVRS